MKQIPIKPISPLVSWGAALFLGLVVGVLLIVVGPQLQARYWLSPTHCLVAVAIPFFIFQITLALVLYRREGRKFDWQSMAERFRFRQIRGAHWVYLAIGMTISIGTYTALMFTEGLLMSYFPDWWASAYDESVVVDHSGDYFLLALLTIAVILNVVGEELFWRGYLLPRQELQHGTNTWWIHGLQFWFFHLFRPWQILMLLPGMLIYGWLATKTRSFLPGLIMHGCTNSLAVFFLFLEVIG